MPKKTYPPVYVGETLQISQKSSPHGEYVTLSGETCYKIRDFDAMPPFFMSIVSSTDHWLFIASTGGLSAGRVNADAALFPYYTEDKLTENSENTGSKTILLVRRGTQTWLWEPFSIRQQGHYHVERNLYKNISSTALVFEEINHTLELVFRYAWRTSDRFGFIKTAWLRDTSLLNAGCRVEVLDGIQNILPANTTAAAQNLLSCLLDAYKRSELEPETGMGIFSLNSTLTDLAEPSESLLATTVFQVGLQPEGTLLSSLQLDSFRAGGGVEPETEIRGRRGAYFVHARLDLEPGEERSWHIVAETNQDHPAIIDLKSLLKVDPSALVRAIEQDIDFNAFNLQRIVARADGLQVSADPLSTAHHFANVLFNIMRGGIFADQYWIERKDLVHYAATHNRHIVHSQAAFFESLPEKLHISALHQLAEQQASADLRRLVLTYLPLTFSRRHGDPSRPWNRFNISIKNSDGSQRLDYEGNWRDIFQNWEALAYSYPEYIEGMIYTFLSATTADGYNPYRITRSGIDWEIPEEGNLWANIGYWSDHQIIYLQKLMEISQRVHPGKLRAILHQRMLSYANVPYRIKPFEDLLKDHYNTIHFDHALQMQVEELVKSFGTDGRLVCDQSGQVLHGCLAEKLLTLLLAKLVNFVPEGGIWMNTQRPEWNDANNALVGKGLSVVTLGYLRRFIAFFRHLLSQELPEQVKIRIEVRDLLVRIAQVLEQHRPALAGSFSDERRLDVLSALGQAGSAYREDFYAHGFSGKLAGVRGSDLLGFLELAQEYVEHSLRANRRADNLYHAYNILNLEPGRAQIGNLYEMLEGQVSILSSGLLNGEESLALLQSLRNSALYRADQHTYILYPDRNLPPFLEKNRIRPEQVAGLALPGALVKARDNTLLVQDVHGDYHFAGSFRNVKHVRQALQALRSQPEFAALVEAEGQAVIDLFEQVFCHAEFTGRSGTFFAYEGLGSIYWHMVSKLLLAVQETALRCQDEPAAAGLLGCYADIRAGLGFHKPPQLFGAFPTDPYSHTPKGQGARQPGMTGMVKEEILTRQAEVGMTIEGGCLVFNPLLVSKAELLPAPVRFTYLNVADDQQQIDLPEGSLAYFCCQVPVIVRSAERNEIEVHYSDETVETIAGGRLNEANSRHIFQRDDVVQYLVVSVVLKE